MKKQLKDMYKKIELLETLENKMHKTTNFNERLVRENEKLKKKNSGLESKIKGNLDNLQKL